MATAPRFIVHVGYPKTATTTLQVGLYESSGLVHYLGKYIPSHRYADERLHGLIETLVTGYERDFIEARGPLTDVLRDWQALAGDRPTVLSYENFLHPWATDPGLIARRLGAVAPHAHILVVLREQTALLTSFYRWHGGYGQYLFLNKYVDEPCIFPLSADEWMHFQFMFPSKNILGLIDYDGVIADYEDVFGADHVHVLTYETLDRDFDTYVRQLAAVLEIDAEAAARHLRGVRANSEGGLLLPGESAQTPLTSRMSEAMVARVRDRFAASNRRLDARRPLGLAALGYAV